MMVLLKNNLMADGERKAAVDNVARIAAEQSGKLKNQRAAIRRALSGLARLAQTLDERDTATDALLTAADRKELQRNHAGLRRIEAKVTALQSGIFDALAEVGEGKQFADAAMQDLLTAMQQYQFSLQAPAPLPRRANDR